MMIGYGRVSTQEQELQLQIDALKKAGCEKIYSEKISSIAATRPEYLRMLESLRPGDTVVVYSLSRLGRGLRQLVNQVEDFEKQGIQFKSLTENIDTSSANGRLQFNLFCALAQFERELLSERTKAGLKVAREKNKIGGRKATLDKKQIIQLQELHAKKELSIQNLCDMFKISKTALYRYLSMSV